jgi:hypothetical protein
MVFVLNIILNNILLFSKINHILFNFFKFYLTKSNLVIRALNSNNIRIQHPNESLAKKKQASGGEPPEPPFLDRCSCIATPEWAKRKKKIKNNEGGGGHGGG